MYVQMYVYIMFTCIYVYSPDLVICMYRWNSYSPAGTNQRVVDCWVWRGREGTGWFLHRWVTSGWSLSWCQGVWVMSLISVCGVFLDGTIRDVCSHNGHSTWENLLEQGELQYLVVEIRSRDCHVISGCDRVLWRESRRCVRGPPQQDRGTVSVLSHPSSPHSLVCMCVSCDYHMTFFADYGTSAVHWLHKVHWGCSSQTRSVHRGTGKRRCVYTCIYMTSHECWMT